MADKKVTIMVIKVDLGCQKCTKKIKKILCGIPQIHSQIYDEKANTVTVTVVCCSPEKIKKKICCKGGDSVKGIEIKEPEKPKPPAPEKPKEAAKPKEPEKPKEKPKEPEKPKEKPKEAEKPKEKPKEQEKPKEPKKVVIIEPPKESEKPEKVVIVEPPKEEAPKPKPPEPAPKAPEPAPKAPEPVPVPMPAYPQPVRACCQQCYQGYDGGPCFQGFGSVAAPYNYEGYGTPAPCYEAYGRPIYDSWSGGGGGGGGAVYYGGCQRGCYVGRCDCVSAENQSACSIM